MNSSETYITLTPGLITEDGEVTNDGTGEFLQNFMTEFRDSSPGTHRAPPTQMKRPSPTAETGTSCLIIVSAGLTKERIAGALIHCIPYVGFPRCLNALSLLKEVMAERSAGAAPEANSD